ncbi:uncharacterized protein EDB91DRAFT_1144913 [Suillus paluster]|uniref:uncharacterized protein n=1 Tax=Suillus paluster TaxID=48578 RepID=UPI001B86F60F|nr:uncharacterized protein EDB91DRAFT_1144913 [Suillus paluster]KAG1735334.1 hypothetical protein EDB91DRAFT_1144913 [Suillus paluster]
MMQGGFLTEDDLEKYFVSGEHPCTSILEPPSFSSNWQQPTFSVGGPSLTSQCSSRYPSHDQSVYRVPEIQQLPSGAGTNPSCCTTILSSDSMSEENLWSRMVTRPSLRRSQRPMCYDMQQDVLNIVGVDVSARLVFCPQVTSHLTRQDTLSAESVTVVEMPSLVLKPASYTGNKPPEMTMDAFYDKSIKSSQSDSSHTTTRAVEAKSEGKGKGIEKHTSSNTCFLPNLRLNKAWDRLRRWTATALRDMKSRTAHLSSTTRPISLAGCTDQRNIWRYPLRNDDRGRTN